MMYLLILLMSFLAIVVQMVAADHFFLLSSIDLPLILTAFWAAYRNRTQALFVGALTGLLLDAAMGWPLGYNGFGRTLAAFVFGQSWKRFNTREVWVQFLILAVSSCTSSLSILILCWIMQREVGRAFPAGSIVQAIVTAFFTVVLFALLKKYARGLKQVP